MTADEAIAIFDEIMRPYLRDQGTAFHARAMEDVILFRHQTKLAVSDLPDDNNPPLALPFNIPEGYSDDGELFVVFLAFVSYFLDPVVCVSEVASSFRRIVSDFDIAGIAVVAEFELQPEGEAIYDELEFVDAERLRTDASDMVAAAESIGQELFGNRFLLSDFTGIGRSK